MKYALTLYIGNEAIATDHFDGSDDCEAAHNAVRLFFNTPAADYYELEDNTGLLLLSGTRYPQESR